MISDAQVNGEASEPKRKRSRLPGIALGLGVALLATVVLLVVMARQRAPRLTRADYDAALERWEQQGPASYDLDLELSGNRPGVIHVEVRAGEVVHMTRDGVEPRQQRTWEVWSVPGQFETISQELDMAADPAAAFATPGAAEVVMWAQFDPQYGYPRQYDRVVLGADFEVHWKVTEFRPIAEKNAAGEKN